MVRQSQESAAERLAYTAQAMVQLRTSTAVQNDVARKFNVNVRTVQAWMRAVRLRWREEQLNTDVDTARDSARADLNAVIALALNKRTVVKTKDGDPLLDPKTNNPVTRGTPDLMAAIRAMKQLHDLDGLPQPMRTEVKIEGDVQLMPDLAQLDGKALVAITKALESIAPGGDIGKLIGEHFKLSGETAPSK